jgi:CBS domain containing-hemolysin-like protein
MLDQIFLLSILLFFSGFFSSAETALFSISTTKARHLSKSKNKFDKLISKMKRNPHKLLSTILIGNNIINIGASALATSLTMEMFPNHAIGIATGVMSLLILVFGEVFPKSLATRNYLVIARMSIYPIYWLSILLCPVIFFLNFIPKITGKIKKDPIATEEELLSFVEVVEEEGEIREEEKNFIHNIFEFDDINASEIMTSRADMFYINIDNKLDIKKTVSSGFTRIPIIKKNIDNIVGILNIKDLFLQSFNKNGDLNISQIMTKPYFIPENKKINTLLHQFKIRKNHMAIIVDEYGGTSGLITLEDVIEELVGEISDETDKEEQHITQLTEHEWIVLGKSDIEEINKIILMNIPESPEYDTFSGYILDKIGKIPKEKEIIDTKSFTIKVKTMDRNRIKELLVKQKSATS